VTNLAVWEDAGSPGCIGTNAARLRHRPRRRLARPKPVPGTVKPPSRYDYYTNQTYLYQDSAYFAAFIGKQAPSARSVLKALADDLDVCPRTEEK
jgi:hypothetical protein